MAESVKIEGGGDGVLIAVGILMFCVIISLVVWAMNPDILKLKKEGDDCKVEDGDIRGTYEIDDKGKCVLKSCDSGWKIDGKKCTKIIESIGGDKVPPPVSPAPAPAPPPAPNDSAYIFKTETLKQPVEGYPNAIQKGYMSGLECENTCSLDDDCGAAMYTDNVNTTVNDNACWHFGKPTGDDIEWKTHTHYTTAVKTQFSQPGIYANPKFTMDGPETFNTPWGDTIEGEWSVFGSPSANGNVYKPWHVFSRDTSREWSSFTGQDSPHVGIKYPGKVILKGYVVTSHSDQNNYIPDRITIEGSNNGESWTVIKSHTVSDNARGYNKNKYSIIARNSLETNSKEFSYYRVRVSSDNRATVFNNINDVVFYTTLNKK